MVALAAALAPAIRGARAASLHLVDSTFDAPPVARLFLVDPVTGDLALEADLDASYAPYLGLAAIDATRFYATGTDATCGPGVQGCVLLELTLSPPSTVAAITPLGTITDAATGLTLVGMVGLTFRSNGLLYASSEDTDSLYVLDPATAEATLVGPAGIDLHGGDITFDAAGRLWAWTNSGSAAGLYRLDPATGAATLLDGRPDLSFTGLTALGHSDLLFGCSPDDGSLYTVDPEAGLTGDVQPLVWSGVPYDLSRGDLDSPRCESASSCPDEDACTEDSCAPGGCEHKPIAGCCHADGECDDANDCTDDTCSSGNVCNHAERSGGCDDGDACTTADACVEGICVGGPAPVETCDGADNDCDGSVDEGFADTDVDGVCDGRDNCPLDANAGQQDLDGDGSGDACDFGIASPASAAVLDCADAAPRPVITWSGGAYDRYRVEIGWTPDFSSKVTSGDTLLSAHAWSPGRSKWKKVCARASGSIHIRVFGVDKNRPRSDPARKAYSPSVTAGVQH